MPEQSVKTGSIQHSLITRTILGVIATAGIVGVAAVAPGAFQLVRLLRKSTVRRYEAPSYIRRTIKSLQKRGLVRVTVKSGEMRVYLTEKGEREVLKYQIKEKCLLQGHWDKKWRIIIFDIEERRRFARDGIRSDMEELGLVRLQDSVWVYPFDCEEVVTLLKAHYKLGKQLVYITAGDIENDTWLRKQFNLK